MFIYQLGWHWAHAEPFAIERPNGHFGHQIILTRSKGRLKMGDKEYHVEKNTVFIVTRCLPHCIYSDGEEYCDDWIRFSPEQEDYEFFSALSPLMNVPIKLNDDGVSNLIAGAVEIFNSEIPQKKDTLHHILCAILTHISASAVPAKKPSTTITTRNLISSGSRYTMTPDMNGVSLILPINSVFPFPISRDCTRTDSGYHA